MWRRAAAYRNSDHTLASCLRRGLVLTLGDVGENLSAAVRSGQTAKQEAQIDHRLHLFPAGTGPSRGNSVQRRCIVQVHEEHAEQHELCGLDVEALRVHAMAAHLL